ncbi:hypothetical protein [Chelativorans sp. YIM 93263]|uniref:hypothetical protein n=1 Tax=Chelativorans sp. YIM 93263 TaxID=2906648 RepID=UPI0023784DA9|nr:hypothetical protein [Chelativorans sp. YIM 93263]
MRRAERARGPSHRRLTGLMIIALSLAGCQGTGGSSSMRTDSDDAIQALQRVNEAGVKCWMDSAGFEDLRLIPELDTTVGRPRLLLLEKGKTRGLPLMVIEASGAPVKIETYGPLSGTPSGERVNADIGRWSAGSLTCQA